MKPMTQSEKMVGRRLPPYPKHIDTLMASFVTSSDASQFCIKFTPSDSWLRPAHKKARTNGWIRFNGLSFGKGAEMWELTDTGKIEALAANKRVAANTAARAQWGRDCYTAFLNTQVPA